MSRRAQLDQWAVEFIASLDPRDADAATYHRVDYDNAVEVSWVGFDDNQWYLASRKCREGAEWMVIRTQPEVLASQVLEELRVRRLPPIATSAAAPAKPNKLTLADIEAEIAVEHYFNGHAAAAVGMQVGIANEVTIRSLMCLTICVLTLHNGHKAVGINHGPVDPAEFSAEDGRRYAREDAIAKLWNPLGFQLRDKMARDALSKPALTEADAAADLAGTPRPSSTIISMAAMAQGEEAAKNERARRAIDVIAKSRVITPTIGRKVWFYPGPSRVLARRSPDPLDATIVFVWGDRMVNLLVVDHDGKSHPITSVHLVQPGDLAGPNERAEWMPYQVKQANGA